MMSIVSGLALSLSGGVAVTGVPASFSDLAYELVLGIPVPVIIALAVLLIAFLVLQYTLLGRRIYAVGGNEEAARLSGIQIGTVKVVAYVFSGMCAAVGSIILTARVASGQPSLGTTLPLESVAAVVLGGISLFGGSRLRRRRRVRGAVRQHSLKWSEFAERFFLHADDGHRGCTDPGRRAGSGLHRLACGWERLML